MRIPYYLLFIFLLASCTKNKFPEDVLKPKKMEAVFWDIIRAEVLVTDYPSKDTSITPLAKNISLQKKIFQAHGVTKDQFYKSFNYYSDHPGLMTALLDSMITTKSPGKLDP